MRNPPGLRRFSFLAGAPCGPLVPSTITTREEAGFCVPFKGLGPKRALNKSLCRPSSPLPPGVSTLEFIQSSEPKKKNRSKSKCSRLTTSWADYFRIPRCKLPTSADLEWFCSIPNILSSPPAWGAARRPHVTQAWLLPPSQRRLHEAKLVFVSFSPPP